MGYLSTFSGAYSPVCKIDDSMRAKILNIFINRFGQYACNQRGVCGFDEEVGRNYTGTIFYNTKDDTIYPVYCEMKAYDFPYEVKYIVEELMKIGVSIEGFVDRSGEEFGDCERISVRDGKVISQKTCLSDGEEIIDTENPYNKLFGR